MMQHIGAAYQIATYAVKLMALPRVGNNQSPTPATNTTRAVLKIEIHNGNRLPTNSMI